MCIRMCLFTRLTVCNVKMAGGQKRRREKVRLIVWPTKKLL